MASVGQACADALAAWLLSALSSDITVRARWPSAGGPQLQNRTVTITKIGKRQRLDISRYPRVLGSTPIDATHARVALPIGNFIQPLQIDIWCTNDPDRDDLVDQVDDALTAGVDRTVAGAPVDNPVRDGILIPLAEQSGWVGLVECAFDEPDIDDGPDSIGRSEYRATYFGDARGDFARVRTVPLLKTATINVTTS